MDAQQRASAYIHILLYVAQLDQLRKRNNIYAHNKCRQSHISKIYSFAIDGPINLPVCMHIAG